MSLHTKIKRFCKGAFNVPVGLVKSRPKSVSGYANVFSPLRKSFFSAFEFNKNIVSAVATLLFVSSPFAILRSVVTAVVNTLNRHVFIWFRPEIAVKVLERIDPSVTNFDASASVVMEGDVAWIKTSLFHGSPRLPFCGVCHSVGAVVRSFGDISLKATARLRPSTYKFRAYDGHLVPALTNAVPLNFTGVGSLWALLHNSESAKALARKVEFDSQNILRMNIARVEGAWQSNTVFDFQPLSLATQRNYIHAT